MTAMPTTYPYLTPKPTKDPNPYMAIRLDTHVNVHDIHGLVIPLAIQVRTSYRKGTNCISTTNLKQDAVTALQVAIQNKFDRKFNPIRCGFSMSQDLLDAEARVTGETACKQSIQFSKKGYATFPFSKIEQQITGTSMDGLPFKAKALMTYQIRSTPDPKNGNVAKPVADAPLAFLNLKAKQFTDYWAKRDLRNFVETFDYRDDHMNYAIIHDTPDRPTCTEQYHDIVVSHTQVQFEDEFWGKMITTFTTKHIESVASNIRCGRYIFGLIGSYPCSKIKGDLRFSEVCTHYQAVTVCSSAHGFQPVTWLILLCLQMLAWGLWNGLYQLGDTPLSYAVPWTALLLILSVAFGPFWLVLSALQFMFGPV